MHEGTEAGGGGRRGEEKGHGHKGQISVCWDIASRVKRSAADRVQVKFCAKASLCLSERMQTADVW